MGSIETMDKLKYSFTHLKYFRLLKQKFCDEIQQHHAAAKLGRPRNEQARKKMPCL